MKFIKRHYVGIILSIVSIVFFFIYVWFVGLVIAPEAANFDNQFISSWPDEMSNHFFIDKFVETGELKMFEPLNSLGGNIIHPRSVNVLNGNLVPTGFLGIILAYGLIGKITGSALIIYFTALFAVLGVCAWFGLIRRIFNEQVAWISAMLLFTLAPFWYYANLSMLGTSFFISAILIGYYFYVRQMHCETERWKLFLAMLSGLFLGIAIITRPVEIIWIGILILIPFLISLRHLYIFQMTAFVLGIIAPIVFMLYYNNLTYGSYFAVGYLRFQESGGLLNQLPTEFGVATGKSILTYIQLFVAPFGFHPRLIWFNFLKYFLEFVWPYFILFAGGVSLMIYRLIKKQLNRNEKTYLISGGLIGFWLIIYYGSWQLADPLVLSENTIGSSYVRYWLPLYILMLPAIGYALMAAWRTNVKKIVVRSAVILALVFLMAFSAKIVYATPGDGLIVQNQVIETYYAQAKAVAALVPTDAIIITERADKLFFPKYKVIVTGDEDVWFRAEKIFAPGKFYYFTMANEAEIAGIDEKYLTKLNLVLKERQKIDNRFGLYRLDRLTSVQPQK